MESPETQQKDEITVLRSIFADEFIECPPKAWKGAPRLPEFIIKIAHPEPEHASKVAIELHVKFPKGYPPTACPIFSIMKDHTGVSDAQSATLIRQINIHAKSLIGSEMVLEIYSFVQEWLRMNVVPPVEVVGSLALQMNQRATEEARERQRREQEEAERLEEMKRRELSILQTEIEEAEKRKMEAKQIVTRQRANSEATEVPDMSIYEEADILTETFQDIQTSNGARFNTVKLFHPRAAHLGLVYLAEPIVEDSTSTPPLELYVVTFDAKYYLSTQGRKKISHVEQEIRELIKIRHPKLLSIYAVKLSVPPNGPPRLLVLMEQTPALTLHDVLEDSEPFREERASDYVGQILTALNALHLSGLVHKGINVRCIGLTSMDNPSQPKTIKLCRAGFHTQLLDLHRSNDFGRNTPAVLEDPKLSDGWASDVQNESPLLYTKQRDIHDVGIALMQMLIGLNVTDRFADPASALNSSTANVPAALARQVMLMLQPPKGARITCDSLLSDLNGVMRSPLLTTGRDRSVTFSASEPKTPMAFQYGSPEAQDYFRLPAQRKQMSRWKEDWEELERLGQGAFGAVVKARNKIDARIYAVKKIRLKKTQSDTKIFREVNALSRLSHRNIVRYYTTWVETIESYEGQSAPTSDSSGNEGSTDAEDGMTSVPDNTSERHLPINGGFQLNIEDFDDLSVSRSSFPSIHFSRSSSRGSASGEEDSTSSDEEDDYSGLFRSLNNKSKSKSQSTSGPQVNGSPTTPVVPHIPPVSRILYIQMEFVERQTLKEVRDLNVVQRYVVIECILQRIDEGITEDEAWRLFQQIVDALVHMSALNILHRDIKLTNIFIDAKGDCKIGDFGLATSSLAAVDPSDVAAPAVIMDADMTLEVGTRLYIAPEVQSRRRVRGVRDHSKADIYSLGIVFFEMNFKFNTGAERIAVLEALRKPSIVFPAGWNMQHVRQREIITWLLQHEPDKRPSAYELSQSPLLPSKFEDESFKAALRLMSKVDSSYHQTALATLFKQPPRASRAFIYDSEIEPPEYVSLNNVVVGSLVAIFQLHGAVETEPPLLTPIMDLEEQKSQATFIDQHGDIVALPNNLLVPFARLTARESKTRIKRYNITNIYQPNPIAGHPTPVKAALFDIISPDLKTGPIAAAAEIISVVSDCLDNFPNISQYYDIHISHSKIVEIVINRVPQDIREDVIDILLQTKPSASQKRKLLIGKGLSRTTADELEILSEVEDDVDDIVGHLEKTSPGLVTIMQTALQEVKDTIQFAHAAGVSRPIFFRPLMLGSHHTHFKEGVLVEAVKRTSKNIDLLAAGGRYDKLIDRFRPLKQQTGEVCAMGVQISVEKISAAVASYQSTSLKTLVKEERSFGFWSPRRCDVYVVSYQPGHLQERLEVVAYLWQNNISADLMYESGLPDSEQENHLDICAREGILFTVYPRPRTALLRNHPAFKVKSILKGTESDLSKQELVSWLQHQIAEQKRVDATTSGAPILAETPVRLPVIKETATDNKIDVLRPDQKKPRKTKYKNEGKVESKLLAVANSIQSGTPVMAVDVDPPQFDAMTRSSAWVTDEGAFKTIASSFALQPAGYAQQIREAVLKRKAEGSAYILMFSLRDDRVQLLSTS